MINAASSHVSLISNSVDGEIDSGETSCKVLFMAPVGKGNLTVGYNIPPGRSSALSQFLPEYVVLPIHLKVINPAEQTLLEQDIITPAIFPINFDTRGEYKVYLTNNGSERSGIGIGTMFESNNPQNREADKYLLASALIVAGVVCTLAGLALNLVYRRLSKTNSKILKQTGVKP
jgi:hypothetical protein